MFPAYQWLAYSPWAACFEVYVIVLGTMHAGRHYFQNNPFQLSYSALFGGLAIFFTYTIAGEVLQRPGIMLDPALQTIWFHLALLAVGIGAGLFFQVVISKRGWMWEEPEGNKTEWMDLAYSLFFLPFIVYLCLIAGVVVLMYGGWATIKTALALYSFYTLTVVADNILGVLDQTPYDRDHKVRSRNDPW